MERARTKEATVEIFESDEFRISVLQRVSIESHLMPVGCFVSGRVEPVAVVVERIDGDRRVVTIG